jgi:hypothetical protein
MRMAIEKCDVNDFEIGEEELRRKYNPDAFVCRLRTAFWREYDAAQAGFRDINVPNIAMMMGTPTATVMVHLKNPKHLPWILCAPASYDIILDEMYQRGMNRVAEIINVDFYKPDGSVDKGLAELVLKAIAFVDMRKNGAVVQKQLHVHTSTRDVKQFAKDITVKQIDERIAELEQRLGTAEVVSE